MGGKDVVKNEPLFVTQRITTLADHLLYYSEFSTLKTSYIREFLKKISEAVIGLLSIIPSHLSFLFVLKPKDLNTFDQGPGLRLERPFR
jgi:hypothetical protein